MDRVLLERKEREWRDLQQQHADALDDQLR